MAPDKKTILWELLVLRCKRGERQAFDDLIRQFERRLFYYVRRLVETEQDAWDVLQQTWLQVFKGIRSLEKAETLPAWLYRIARAKAASRWREQYRQQARSEEYAELAEIEAPNEACHFDNAEQVHRALEQVSLAHREVLTLFFLEDLSLDQMADVLAIPLGTVKSRLWHARRALRAAIERERGQS